MRWQTAYSHVSCQLTMETRQVYPRLFLLFGIVTIVLTVLFGLSRRGFAQDTAIVPIDEATLSAEKSTAQQIALNARSLHQQIANDRAEVFHISRLPFYQPDGRDLCGEQQCYQLDIYLWDSNTTLTAIVDNGEARVLGVHRYEETQPAFSARLSARATELLIENDELAAALGHRPSADEIALMDGQRGDAPGCDGSELCVAASFVADSGSIWAIVNLSRDVVARIWWADRPFGADQAAKQYRAPISAEYRALTTPTACNNNLTYAQDGWSLSYGQSNSDGLHAWNISYLDTPVVDSIRLPEWHVDYTVQDDMPFRTGFIDYNACSTGFQAGSFRIIAYGEPEIRPIVVTTTASLTETIGFELVQDYRQFNWGFFCNYRYDQRYQFYADGRWRVVAGSFGRGCGNGMEKEAHYRPIFRIDLASGSAGNQFESWDGAAWQVENNESWHGDGDASGDGFVTNSNGHAFRIHNGISGFLVEPGAGQFGDGGTGDNGWIYHTKFDSDEGAADMPRVGDCCNADYEQGPEAFVDGEATSGEDIVLWVVPDQATITEYGAANGLGDAAYCWTETTADPSPCLAGPMFVPVTVLSPTAVTQSGGISAETLQQLPLTLLTITLVSILSITIVYRHKKE